jgi:3-oxoacyl-[acyl-carrier protein] reductase
LIGLTKSLGKEVAGKGILVNAVTPAAARTEIFDSMDKSNNDVKISLITMGRILHVDEAAAMIAWLSSEDCAFSTGAVFDLSGGRATY